MNITTSLHIALPDTLNQFVKERVAEEHFNNPSDYIRALIREDQKRRENQKLEQILLEGIASGPGVMLGTAEWENVWKKIETRIESKMQKT